MDEAAARLRIQVDSLPYELDTLERRIASLQIEKQALLREKDQASHARLEMLPKELADVEDEARAMRARWQNERDAIKAIQALKREAEDLRGEADRAEKLGNYDEAAKLKYGRLPQVEQKISGTQERLRDLQADRPLLKEEVDEDDIALVVSLWTGVPRVPHARKARKPSSSPWRTV